MARIVYCWEMGAGLGHMMPLAALCAELVAQGHTVTAIVCDMTSAPTLLAPHGVSWLPAPRLPPAPMPKPPVNHAEIMHMYGYDAPDRLFALMAAWRSLFGLLKPDQVICEYSPTARLAADSMGLPLVCIDSGFYMPPLSDPLPVLRDHEPLPIETLRSLERRTLDVVNVVLGRFQGAGKAHFHSLFDYPTWYRNWVEFNHFGPHSPDRHMGQILADSAGTDPVWPAGSGPKVFAYLRPRHAESLPILEAAVSAGFRVLAYLPGFHPGALQGLVATGRLIVSEQPVRLGELGDDVEIGIWHSPTGAVARCLDKNMRMIFLPLHIEMLRAGRAVERAGLPAHVSIEKENWTEVFRKVMTWPRPACGGRWMGADVAAFARALTLV